MVRKWCRSNVTADLFFQCSFVIKGSLIKSILERKTSLRRFYKAHPSPQENVQPDFRCNVIHKKLIIQHMSKNSRRFNIPCIWWLDFKTSICTKQCTRHDEMKKSTLRNSNRTGRCKQIKQYEISLFEIHDYVCFSFLILSIRYGIGIVFLKLVKI